MPQVDPSEISLIEALHSTPSRRYLSAEPISDEVLWAILDAAVRGPTGGDRQAWGWVLVSDDVIKKQIAQCYREGRQRAYGQRRAEILQSAEADTGMSCAGASHTVTNHAIVTDSVKPAVTAVLWDIDGTLLSSAGGFVGAFLDAVFDVVGRRPEGRGLDLGGRIDPEIAVALLNSVGADERLVPEVLARLHENVSARFEELRQRVQPLPGVARTLASLAAAGVRQTIVTGNIESVARMKLAAAALIPPIDASLGGFGDSGVNRVEVANHSLQALVDAGWRYAPQQCWIVGDTPRDLSCAKALGLRCALVGTGRHSVDSMARLGADVVIADLNDARELFDLWNVPVSSN